MPSELELFHEMSFYTLAHTDSAFLHQNAVDAFTAQQADLTTKPIAVVFALVGLYLHVEKQFTGRQVQKVHMQLANRRKGWTMPPLPPERGSERDSARGSIRVADVLAASPGPARDAMIHRWCETVWEAFHASRAEIAQLLATELDI